jgi:hypothetical protein
MSADLQGIRDDESGLTLMRSLAFEAGNAPLRLLSRLDAAMIDLSVEALATAVVAHIEPRLR